MASLAEMNSIYPLTGLCVVLLACKDALAAFNNSHIVDVLEEIDSIKSPRVIDAMIHVDRGHFCAKNDSRKYMMAARDIGYGSILDNPVQHAEVLELLKDKLVPGAKVLDIGSGSGYLTTCFAHMVGKNGSVVGVEHIPEIVTHASNATTTYYPKLNKRIKFVCGDGRLGYPEGGPYDVIHVGASSESVPKAFLEQMKINGLMVIFVGTKYDTQKFYLVEKHDDGTYSNYYQHGIIVHPLTDAITQIERYNLYEATTPDRLKEYADLVFSPEESLYKIDVADRTDLGSLLDSDTMETTPYHGKGREKPLQDQDEYCIRE